MEKTTLAYWIATGLFCVALGFSGLAHTLKLEPVVSSMAALGYPLYFMSIIGLFKLAGVLTLLVPATPLLKEWAYAGFAFNLIGATASHAMAGDPLSHTVRPALVLLVGIASYALRPASRRTSETFLTLGQGAARATTRRR
jgi:hypothetical protein